MFQNPLDLWLVPACLGPHLAILGLHRLCRFGMAFETNENSSSLRLLGLPSIPFACRISQATSDPWPCANHCAISTLEVSLLLPFNFFARFFGMVVGEASNPGPPDSLEGSPIKLVVSNPTAVHKKTDEVVALGADVVIFSETSATSVVQTEMTDSLMKFGFKSFWSKPVPNKKITLDFRPSYRGEAIGTSIFSKIPSRAARVSIPPFLWDSCRICCSVVRLQGIDVLLVSVYGFATRYQHGIRMNDVFLAAVFDVVQQVDMPFIVAGDFNDPPQCLPAFSLFAELGAVEAFPYFKSSRDVDLPATCLGSTRNDTVIFHPWLVPYICDMRVESDHQFDSHVPLAVFLDFCRETPTTFKWYTPCSWAALAPPKDLIDTCYKHISFSSLFDVETIVDEHQTEAALLAWSQAVELAVDKAIQISHRLNPVVFPWPPLHPKYKGRCNVKKTCRAFNHRTIRDDPTGAFNPVSEVFFCEIQTGCTAGAEA